MTFQPERMVVTFRNADPFPVEVIDAIKAHAIACYPQESVGVVMADGYVPCVNVHREPEKAFEVDPEETKSLLQRGAILALVHSHPEGPNFPSLSDQRHQIASGMTWGIVPIIGTDVMPDIDPVAEADEDAPPPESIVVPVPSDILWWGDALPIPPMKCRKFIWGIFHCWALVRDWYRVERGVTFPNFAVGDDFIENGESVFIDNVERAGLRDMGKLDMNDLQVGDILVGHLKGQHPSHCGVYLGGDDFLHHPPGAPSSVTQLVRWWKHIDTVFRYYGDANTSSVRRTG